MPEPISETRKFTFRGKTLEELQAMPMSEFMKLIKSRARRALKRGFTDIEKKLIIKAKQAKPGAFIKTHAREMVVLPEFVGKRFGIYNGKEWRSVDIKEEMLGHRLGEFSMTRKERVKHSGPGIGATRGSKFISVK